MIQLWSAIAVAVLTVVVGPLLRGEVSGRLAKRIAVHAEMRSKMEGNALALEHLDALLASETQILMERETHRLTRKLNGGNVAALIFVAFIGGAIVYGLVSAAVVLQSAPPLFWALVALAVLVGLFTIALAAAGMGTLYAPQKESNKKSPRSR